MPETDEQSAPTDGYRVGVDTGGTFTDLVLIGPDGHVAATHKRLSTPDDPSRAVLDGIDALLAAHGGGLTRNDVRVTHGSTVATNALLEADHGATVFVTTAGFEDTLHLARQHRPDLYALVPHRPDPPVTRSHCVGVRERIGHDGRVIEALTAEALAAVVGAVSERKPEAVAVSLLHSYANPAHERRIAEALREALGSGIHLTVSHDLLPEFREYERAATCVINAVVAPRMSRYLRRIEAAMTHEETLRMPSTPGPSGRGSLRIMGSHGGTMTVDEVCAEPVRTILSGPAGGVRGAARLDQKLITLDMGGTSTDVALIEDEPTRSREHEAAGLPVRLPMVDIHTVGAGGGSVAWLDAGGALRVGPRSAGADPGPAAYGRQRGRIESGDLEAWQPTVTDAHVVLGHLSPDAPLGNGLRLDACAAREAVQSLADAAGLGLEATAEGVVRVVEVNMARAVHRISLQRGRDPRGYTLVPFGGAGGLHACSLATQLGMTRVRVPVSAGLLSAVGMLTAPPRRIVTRAVHREWDVADWPRQRAEILTAVEELAAKPQAKRAAGLATSGRCSLFLHLRYRGQSHEVEIDATDAGTDPAAAFTTEHERLFGCRFDDRAVEWIAYDLVIDGEHEPLQDSPPATDATPEDDANRNGPGRVGMHRVRRATLAVGATRRGPLIITEPSATTLVPAGWSVTVRPGGTLNLEHHG